MLRLLKNWRRRRLLRRGLLPNTDWDHVQALPWLAGLGEDARARLRAYVTWFLNEKRFYGAAGLEPDRNMCLTVAAMACIPVLHLGYDWLDGWTTVILYPGEFRVRHRHEDEHGLVYEEEGELAGEAWDIGPLVLSWLDVAAAIEYPDDGENVVFHEIAHKLDMRNGEPNGMPPLHEGMNPGTWTAAFEKAFASMNEALDREEETEIDPYAATDPAEFFAVTTEYYFEAPGTLQQAMPEIYRQLQSFYRKAEIHSD